MSIRQSDEDLDKERNGNLKRFRNAFEAIYAKYGSHDSDDDVIDLMTGEVIEDNGRLRNLDVVNIGDFGDPTDKPVQAPTSTPTGSGQHPWPREPMSKVDQRTAGPSKRKHSSVDDEQDSGQAIPRRPWRRSMVPTYELPGAVEAEDSGSEERVATGIEQYMRNLRRSWAGIRNANGDETKTPAELAKEAVELDQIEYEEEEESFEEIVGDEEEFEEEGEWTEEEYSYDEKSGEHEAEEYGAADLNSGASIEGYDTYGSMINSPVSSRISEHESHDEQYGYDTDTGGGGSTYLENGRVNGNVDIDNSYDLDDRDMERTHRPSYSRINAPYRRGSHFETEYMTPYRSTGSSSRLAAQPASLPPTFALRLPLYTPSRLASTRPYRHNQLANYSPLTRSILSPRRRLGASSSAMNASTTHRLPVTSPKSPTAFRQYVTTSRSLFEPTSHPNAGVRSVQRYQYNIEGDENDDGIYSGDETPAFTTSALRYGQGYDYDLAAGYDSPDDVDESSYYAGGYDRR